MALQKSADILLKRKKAACGAARNGEIGFSGCRFKQNKQPEKANRAKGYGLIPPYLVIPKAA